MSRYKHVDNFIGENIIDTLGLPHQNIIAYCENREDAAYICQALNSYIYDIAGDINVKQVKFKESDSEGENGLTKAHDELNKLVSEIQMIKYVLFGLFLLVAIGIFIITRLLK